MAADEFAGLDLRGIVGLGVGFPPVDSQKRSLNLEAKAQRVVEDYVVDEDTEFWGSGWTIDYEELLWDAWLTFYFRNNGVLNLEETERVFLEVWVGLKMPIHGGVVGSAEVNVEHDSEPPQDTEETDLTYRLKLGYEW